MNLDIKPSLARYRCKPEGREFVVRGRRFLLDVNGLALYALQDGETLPDSALCDSAHQFSRFVSPFIRSLTLQLTHTCPLRCKYCFVQEYEEGDARAGKQMMSENLALTSITSFFGQPEESKGEIHLSFFGGEPLTPATFPLLKKVVEFVETAYKGRKISFHATTSGVGLNKEIGSFLREHKFSFVYSLDGPSEIHDTYRVFSSGKGSHSLSLNNLSYIQGCKITLRSTFTPELTKILQRLEYLNQICDEGLATGVSVEPASVAEDNCVKLGSLGAGSAEAGSTGDNCVKLGSLGAGSAEARSPDVGSAHCAVYHSDPPITDLEKSPRAYHKEGSARYAFRAVDEVYSLREEYLQAADWVVERLKAGKLARFHNVLYILRRLALAEPYATECGAGAGILTVSPTGDICACHREKWTKLGRAVDGWVDEAERAKWLDNRIYARPTCMRCGIRYVCGGGCRELSLGLMKDIHEPFPVECAFKELWMEAAIWILSQVPSKDMKEFLKKMGMSKKEEERED